MYNTLIVEDEKLAADRLERMLLQVAPDVRVLEKVDTVKEAVNFLEKQQPDLIFLDIHLADGSGFEIFEKVQVSCPVIFTTAFDEYALQAFQVNGISYLLKPISTEELAGSMRKLKSLQGADQQQQQIGMLLEQIRKREVSYRKRFLVSYGSTIKSISIQEVAYFFAENTAVYLVDNSGSKYILDETLDQLSEGLDPAVFFRVNRSFTVQADAIRQMHAYSRSRIKLDLEPACSKECISSSEKTAEFKDWLGR
ncbi:two component transcriptional regulator, LytTR family [Cyclobacterium lianum]|uniref:Two component transcriptional regulator, LytTR family n=1 Tax=Cyclobacterium lianum TaxID=388280 RepID=A0A1M7Q6G3_9BACT|nr:LytTR family DNA-binding domain-containing protein [Cyclobacterium lianum]SHN26068.1 two component transcriptional regulator, LytTR family [Cyclobacterium lianum]